MRICNLPAYVLVLCLIGCSSNSPTVQDGSTDVTDASATSIPDASSGDATNKCGVIPTSHLCAMEGCNFKPITLDQCDETADPYSFYGTDYCTSKLTLLVVFAEWCEPCREEAPMIQRLITEGYAQRGVRVISVMAQNVSGAPTASHCRLWRDNYHLTSHMAIDPMGLTQIYFPMMAFPANILIDRNGQIIYRAYGTSAGLEDLRQQIDAALGALENNPRPT